MLSATFSVVGLGLVAGTGFATARALGATAFTELVLSAYTIGSAVVLGLVLVLSAFDAVSRTALFAGAATALVVTILFPRRRRCRAPRDRTRRLLADVWNEPPLLVLAIAVGGALIYVLALGLGTAPNTWDSLTYHLARVGFWLQERSIGYVANPYDGRLNGNPPGAEIGVAYLLGLGHSDLLAGIVQFLAALACAVGVYGIARRLGLTATEGAFGGLLFLTLPIVLLQASTTQNDVVVASFLVAATYFLLGDQRREHIVAALAIGMAVSTKLTAIYALPFMAVIGLIARPRTHRVRRMLAVAAGVAAGAWWYVINVVETGHVLGDLPDRSGTTTLLRFKTNLDTLYKFGLDSIDFSGARGADMLLYAGAAAVAGLSVTLGRTAGAIRRPWRAVSTAVLALSPFVLLPASFALWHGYVVLF
ncbi:MAG: glycosyltransferase family 39 protein, partial [Thermoleophilia bacterium]|nr:glycosyltransferase family 39 protein [Thermoleophilia bacterium]